MRIYYVFFIDDAFLFLYKDKPSLLYKNFFHIYRMSYDNSSMGLKIYSQLIDLNNKNNMNEYIYNKHKHELSYDKHKNIHMISNKFTSEFTKLIVYNTYVKIITNKNYPYFFNTLYINNYNLFVCDFENHDYFFLDKSIKELLV